MSPVPLPVRVAVGLAATTVERVLDLPRQIIGLPVTAASRAVQAGMRVQSRVTELAIRGDAVFAAFRPVEDTPPWATFDEDGPAADARPAAPVLPGPGSPERTGAQYYDEPPPDGAPVAPVAPGSANGTGPADGAEADRTRDLAATAVAAAAGAESAPDPGPATPAVGELDEGDVAKALAPEAPATGDGAAGPGTGRREHHGRGEPDVRVVPKPGQTPSTDEPPLPGYDDLTLPQLRGRLRTLSVGQLEELLEHERSHRDRPPFVTMLSNRITTVRAQ